MALPTHKRPSARPAPPVREAVSSRSVQARRAVNVQATFTSREREMLATDASRMGVSISTLCRERIMAHPPIDEWAKAAGEILAEWAIEGDNTDTVVEKKEREPRVIRITSRLTAYESTLLQWRASCLHLSLSDYIRKMVFELAPGQGEDHMARISRTGSPHDRKSFYEAVISISNNGGQFPPNSSGFFCKACASELQISERR